MGKRHELDYLYASARVRALENNLFTNGQVDALLDTRNKDEIIKFLAGLGYDIVGIDADTPDFYEQIIARKRNETLHLVAEMASKPHLFDYFLYLYDYHNLKVILKSEILQKSHDQLLMAAGTIPVVDILKAVREKNDTHLTPFMVEGITAARAAYGKNQNPQMIDIVLDRYCFADMLRCAQETDSEFVVNFVKLQIDLMNVKTFLRLKKINASAEFAKVVFVSGGNMEKTLLMDSFELPMQAAADAFSFYEIGDLFQKAISLFEEIGGIARVELLCDDYLMTYMKKAKYISFGIEPLVAYLYAMENEFKSLKIMIAGKLSGLEHSRIKERLRESYV